MRLAKHLLPLVFLLFLIVKPACAFEATDGNHYKAILANIFNFQFEKAKAQLHTRAINQQDRKFLKIELKWWEAIEKNDKQALTDFYSMVKGYKETVEEENSYLNLIIHTYILRYHMAIKNYPAAAIDYFRIKDIMSNHSPSQKGDKRSEQLFMLYSSLIELAEASYHFNPFGKGIDERKKEHIQKITKHAECDDFIRSTLGHYFLYKYFSELADNNGPARIHRMVLHERFPDNPFFTGTKENFNQILTENTK